MNPTVGDLSGNVRKIIHYLEEARKFRPDIIAFPELAITGYPPEDLLLKPRFIDDNIAALHEVRERTDDAVVILGFVDKRDDIYNAAAIIQDKEIRDIYHKIYLPNYGVFDENRYFQAGTRYPVYQMGEMVFGVNICEDIWYPDGPATVQALAGAQFIININASPYHIRKSHARERMLSTRAADSSVIIAYLNCVGGQDELVFDGGSFVADQNGEIISSAGQFGDEMMVLDLDLDAVFMRRLHDPRRRQQVLSLGSESVERVHIDRGQGQGSRVKQEKMYGQEIGGRVMSELAPCPRTLDPLCLEEEVYKALVTGTRDYMRKNGFSKVCVGLSGGVDSALVAAIAVDALGAGNVTGIFMPSPYTSQESREDAQALSDNLAIGMMEIPISEPFDSYLRTFSPHFRELPVDATEENLQARIRGNILMAFSNKFGWLVLTTGNKSEMSVGYATLYGDMAGGFAVIKDVPKTLVYSLCRWKNGQGKAVIPERIITKEPTAELRPDQKDTDSLPPYEILDPILKAYVEDDRSLEEIVAQGFDEEMVKKVIRMVDLSEYKRRQSPPGIKITPRAFGRDRRFPITNRYRNW
jgi:NAD+ synthase (glutamine-hydrolysing)